jgi:hypothetical protein
MSSALQQGNGGDGVHQAEKYSSSIDGKMLGALLNQ